MQAITTVRTADTAQIRREGTEEERHALQSTGCDRRNGILQCIMKPWIR